MKRPFSDEAYKNAPDCTDEEPCQMHRPRTQPGGIGVGATCKRTLREIASTLQLKFTEARLAPRPTPPPDENFR